MEQCVAVCIPDSPNLAGCQCVICNLDIFYWVYEKILHKRSDSFFDNNKILSENHFGFRKHKNTSQAILKFAEDNLNAFSNKTYKVAVFMDYSKAFETVKY